MEKQPLFFPGLCINALLAIRQHGMPDALHFSRDAVLLN